MLVSPSVLSCDFGNLQTSVELINSSSADWLHLDVMDGVFVPNISFGFPVIEAIQKYTTKEMDVHLMTVKPDTYLDEFARLGTRWISVHYEASTHLHRTIEKIHQLGMKASVALNPHTPVHLLEEILPELDMVLIMSVNPGFGGQKFIPSTIEKVKKMKQMITHSGSPALIEVDGGVNLETGKRLVQAGADVLVAGSFIFQSVNPVSSIEQLKNA